MVFLTNLSSVFSVTLVLLFVYVVEGDETRRNRTNDVHSMRNLGEVDGRSYYVELNKTLTWEKAQLYCEGAGLKAATIETENQANFIRNTLIDYQDKQFWTSARAYPKPECFHWDGGSGQRPVNQTLVDLLGGPAGFDICIRVAVHYLSQENQLFMLYGFCDQSHFPLCQICET